MSRLSQLKVGSFLICFKTLGTFQIIFTTRNVCFSKWKFFKKKVNKSFVKHYFKMNEKHNFKYKSLKALKNIFQNAVNFIFILG